MSRPAIHLHAPLSFETLAMPDVRRATTPMLAIVLAASLHACGGGGEPKTPTESATPIATVTVAAPTTTLVPGQVTQLVASAGTAGGQAVSGAAFTWLSEAPAVAAVDATGRVTALSAGTAVIAARSGAARGTVTLTVQAASTAPVANLTLAPATANVAIGATLALTAEARDSANTLLTGRAITWATSNAAVAAVSGTGVVTGLALGSATVSATSEGRTAVAQVVVSPPSLNAIVDSMRLAWNMPAMGAAIVTLEGGLVAIGAAGTRRASGGAAVTTDDLWHLGSNTKAVTALLAAVAVSQNRIQWTTTLPEVFPELTNVRPEYHHVTLRELLSHQSGIVGNPGDAALGGATTAGAQRASVVKWVVQQPMSGSRGTFSYTNMGYIVAGAMLERVFGTSFESAMSTQIFVPLGMSQAGWGPQATTGSTIQPVAHRWQWNGSWAELENFDIPPGNASSGTMHMSLASWGRFVREVLRAEAGTSTIAPAAIARQTTSAVIPINATTSYGMGWGITTAGWANGKVLNHDGSNTGNHSLAVLAPLRNVAFLVTTNGWDPNGRTAQALGALQSRLVTYYNTGK